LRHDVAVLRRTNPRPRNADDLEIADPEAPTSSSSSPTEVEQLLSTLAR
jgi:hypothetical protein